MTARILLMFGNKRGHSPCERIEGIFFDQRFRQVPSPGAELFKILLREAHPIGAAERRKILATAEGRGCGSSKT